MPAKRKKGGKGKYKRAKRTFPPKAVICYAPQICPDVMRVQLPYSLRKSAVGGGAVDIVDFVLRGNGPNDPDFAVGGQQPIGFDEWSAFYRRYRVTASKVELFAINDAAVSAFAYIVAQNTSSGIVDKNLVGENQFVKLVNVGQDGASNTGNLSMYLSTAQVRGGPQDIVQYEQDLSALTGTTPTQEWFWHVGAYGMGDSNTNFDVDLELRVTYYIDFYDRQTLSRS